MKVACLGGSFDPVHYGHIEIANVAMAQLGVDEVWFVPTFQTPLKDRELTQKEHRLAMLELALKDYDAYRVCTLEIEQETKSYTVDTLRKLHELHPEDSFYWLIGQDQVAQFDLWKEPETCLKLAKFIAVRRNGKAIKSPYDIDEISMKEVLISSSEIRQGHKLNYVSRDVLNYIYAHRLYIHDFVSSQMSEKRYKHSLSVAKLCEQIAISNGLDGQKAYLIGLFHDIAKQIPLAVSKQWMEAKFPELMHWAVAVWHGFVGSVVVESVYYLDDPVIKQAIYHHVLGTSRDPYAMIVFVADKCDPLRGYDSQWMIDLALDNIVKGFDVVYEENRKYLEG